MKIFFAFCFLLVSSLAEPPVNRYLPPQGSSRGSPSQTSGTSFGGQTRNDVYSPPSTTYGAPRSRPISQYLPPSNQYNQRSRNQPTNQYLPPSQYQAPTSQYQTPTNQYQAPSSQYQGPSNQYQAPSNQYGLPSQGFGQAGNQYNTLSQEYGIPGLRRANNYNQQSRQYLPPGGYDDGSNGVPANYNFEYMVKDEYSGNDFGHKESRQGDRAEGLYYVVLPDGRKQTVQYEADQEGYRPRISYEDSGRGGYDSNSQNYDQYSNGPY